MIILRKKNVVEERTFSKPDYLFGTNHIIGIIQQLVKLMNIRTGRDAEDNFSHWIANLQGAFIRQILASVASTNNLIGGYQSMLILNEDKDRIISDPKIRKVFGDELANDVSSGRLKCGDELIIEGIKSAEGDGGMKYKSHFTKLERDKEFIANLRTLLRHIALRLSGQLGPNDDYWDSTWKEVDYTRRSSVKYTEKQVREIIIQSLIKYFEAMGLEYSEALHEYE